MTFDRRVDIAFMDRIRQRQFTIMDELIARGAQQERQRLLQAFTALGLGCENFTRGDCKGNGRTIGARDSADAYCWPCSIRSLLEGA